MSGNLKPSIVRDNTQIKRLILERAKKLNLPLRNVVEEAGIDQKHYRNLTVWLGTSDPSGAGIRMREDLIIQVAKVLGIEVRVQLVLTPLEDLPIHNRDYIRYSKKP